MKSNFKYNPCVPNFNSCPPAGAPFRPGTCAPQRIDLSVPKQSVVVKQPPSLTAPNPYASSSSSSHTTVCKPNDSFNSNYDLSVKCVKVPNNYNPTGSVPDNPHVNPEIRYQGIDVQWTPEIKACVQGNAIKISFNTAAGAYKGYNLGAKLGMPQLGAAVGGAAAFTIEMSKCGVISADIGVPYDQVVQKVAAHNAKVERYHDEMNRLVVSSFSKRGWHEDIPKHVQKYYETTEPYPIKIWKRDMKINPYINDYHPMEQAVYEDPEYYYFDTYVKYFEVELSGSSEL